MSQQACNFKKLSRPGGVRHGLWCKSLTAFSAYTHSHDFNSDVLEYDIVKGTRRISMISKFARRQKMLSPSDPTIKDFCYKSTEASMIRAGNPYFEHLSHETNLEVLK